MMLRRNFFKLIAVLPLSFLLSEKNTKAAIPRRLPPEPQIGWTNYGQVLWPYWSYKHPAHVQGCPHPEYLPFMSSDDNGSVCQWCPNTCPVDTRRIG